MKLKHILAIIAFFATFIFSVLLIGVPVKETSSFASVSHTHTRATQREITNLLKQDIANGDFRELNVNAYKNYSSDGDFSNRMTYGDTINRYVTDSESISDANLPSDFQNAWRDHLRAWRSHADFADISQTSCLMRGLDSFDLRLIYLEQGAEINRTWYKVLRVAKSHGAAIPRNALPSSD